MQGISQVARLLNLSQQDYTQAQGAQSTSISFQRQLTQANAGYQAPSNTPKPSTQAPQSKTTEHTESKKAQVHTVKTQVREQKTSHATAGDPQEKTQNNTVSLDKENNPKITMDETKSQTSGVAHSETKEEIKEETTPASSVQQEEGQGATQSGLQDDAATEIDESAVKETPVIKEGAVTDASTMTTTTTEEQTLAEDELVLDIQLQLSTQAASQDTDQLAQELQNTQTQVKAWLLKLIPEEVQISPELTEQLNALPEEISTQIQELLLGEPLAEIESQDLQALLAQMLTGLQVQAQPEQFDADFLAQQEAKLQSLLAELESKYQLETGTLAQALLSFEQELQALGLEGQDLLQMQIQVYQLVRQDATNTPLDPEGALDTEVSTYVQQWRALSREAQVQLDAQKQQINNVLQEYSRGLQQKEQAQMDALLASVREPGSERLREALGDVLHQLKTSAPAANTESLLKSMQSALNTGTNSGANSPAASLGELAAMTASLGSQVNTSARPLAATAMLPNQGQALPGQPGANEVLAERVAVMQARGMKFAEIHLDPPELGSLQIRIRLNQDQAHVSFHAANPQVREALEAQVNKLRDLLETQGVQLGDVDVSDQSQGESQMAALARAVQEEQARAAQNQQDGDADLTTEMQQNTASSTPRRTLSLVDFYA
ncbi:hook-length control protein FliK [Allopseudospirillum japonicum]|uniref:Hook-length control protein FliK n=1 Tax=Allopseudospirillum japonicum TaxID=64971 RepID=A0A1H6QQJ8_9GAMM|nr:flagellar hook-length control protein FliK [Allopseudospirillum japonicum]SEI45869.1 hook-length control protein FliK [Allopseudospirillum japonicum]